MSLAKPVSSLPDCRNSHFFDLIKMNWYQFIAGYWIHFKNLENGINRAGIPDLILLQQVINQKISLFTFDKHFSLMQKYFTFNLLT